MLATFTRWVPRDTVGTTTALLARIGLQSLTFILISRELGAEGYGLLVGVISIGIVVAPLSSLGIEFIMLRAIALDQAGAPRAIGTSLTTVTLLGPLCCVIAWSICIAMLPNVGFGLMWPILLAEVLLGPVIDICWRAFQGADRMTRAATMRLLPAATRCAFAVLLVLIPGAASPDQWALLYLCASGVAALILLIMTYKHFGAFRFDSSMLRGGVRQSWHFSANVLTERITNDADKFLLAGLGGSLAAGVYGAGYRIVEIFSVPVASVILGANAQVFRAGATAGNEAARALRRLVVLVLVYGIGSGVVLWLGARFVPMLLGEDFAVTSSVIAALAALPLLYGLRSSLWLGLAATGTHGYRTGAQAAIATLNVVANALLIPRFGWIGAVCATLGSEAALTALFALRLRVVRRIDA